MSTVGEITNWLVQQGVREAPIKQIVTGTCVRLREAGVSVDRFSLGGLLLHPVAGARQLLWESEDGLTNDSSMPRSLLLSQESTSSIFYSQSAKNVPFQRFLLAGVAPLPFPQLEEYRAQGYTDYLIYFHSSGRERSRWAKLPARGRTNIPNHAGLFRICQSRRQSRTALYARLGSFCYAALFDYGTIGVPTRTIGTDLCTARPPLPLGELRSAIHRRLLAARITTTMRSKKTKPAFSNHSRYSPSV